MRNGYSTCGQQLEVTIPSVWAAAPRTSTNAAWWRIIQIVMTMVLIINRDPLLLIMRKIIRNIKNIKNIDIIIVMMVDDDDNDDMKYIWSSDEDDSLLLSGFTWTRFLMNRKIHSEVLFGPNKLTSCFQSISARCVTSARPFSRPRSNVEVWPVVFWCQPSWIYFFWCLPSWSFIFCNFQHIIAFPPFLRQLVGNIQVQINTCCKDCQLDVNDEQTDKWKLTNHPWVFVGQLWFTGSSWANRRGLLGLCGDTRGHWVFLSQQRFRIQVIVVHWLQVELKGTSGSNALYFLLRNDQQWSLTIEKGRILWWYSDSTLLPTGWVSVRQV